MLQKYVVLLAPPNNWYILHNFVINGHDCVTKWTKCD